MTASKSMQSLNQWTPKHPGVRNCDMECELKLFSLASLVVTCDNIGGLHCCADSGIARNPQH